MNRQALSLVALTALSLALCACGGRSTAALSKVLLDQGSYEEEWAAEYDDQGRLSEVTRTNNTGDVIGTTTLTYGDDGNVRRVTYEDVDGDEIEYTYLWENGQVVSKEFDGDGDDLTVYTYNDNGQMVREENSLDLGLLSFDSTTNYTYEDGTNVSEWEKVTETRVAGSSPESSDDYTVNYNDNGYIADIERISTDIFGGETEGQSEFKYSDEGRLVEAESESGIDYELTYGDDGRLTKVEANDAVGSEWDFEYSDGASQNIFFVPSGIPFSGLFDLEGRNHPQPDPRVIQNFLIGG